MLTTRRTSAVITKTSSLSAPDHKASYGSGFVMLPAPPHPSAFDRTW